MKFDYIHEYDEMEDNGLMIADISNRKGVKVCQVEHTDLMGGFDEINGEINNEAVADFLVELSDMIKENGADYYGYINIEVNGEVITFTNDTNVFAELRGKEAFILDKEELAYVLVILSSYFEGVYQYKISSYAIITYKQIKGKKLC